MKRYAWHPLKYIAGKYISNSFGVSTLPGLYHNWKKDKIKDNDGLILSII
jgi:hypothetical protein